MNLDEWIARFYDPENYVGGSRECALFRDGRLIGISPDFPVAMRQAFCERTHARGARTCSRTRSHDGRLGLSVTLLPPPLWASPAAAAATDGGDKEDKGKVEDEDGEEKEEDAARRRARTTAQQTNVVRKSIDTIFASDQRCGRRSSWAHTATALLAQATSCLLEAAELIVRHSPPLYRSPALPSASSSSTSASRRSWSCWSRIVLDAGAGTGGFATSPCLTAAVERLYVAACIIQNLSAYAERSPELAAALLAARRTKTEELELELPPPRQHSTMGRLFLETTLLSQIFPCPVEQQEVQTKGRMTTTTTMTTTQPSWQLRAAADDVDIDICLIAADVAAAWWTDIASDGNDAATAAPYMAAHMTLMAASCSSSSSRRTKYCSAHKV